MKFTDFRELSLVSESTLSENKVQLLRTKIHSLRYNIQITFNVPAAAVAIASLRLSNFQCLTPLNTLFVFQEAAAYSMQLHDIFNKTISFAHSSPFLSTSYGRALEDGAGGVLFGIAVL